MRKLLFILLISSFQQTYATKYYVSNAGSDANNGLTISTPWATIAKVNSATFNAGDSILFKRGESWREDGMKPISEGTTGNHIVFSNYGTGNLPIFYGSEQATGWTNVTGNIWKSTNTLTDPSFGTNHDGSVYSYDSNSDIRWVGGAWFVGTDGLTTWGNQEKYSQDSLLKEYDWWWNAGNIYVYAPTDPTTRYNAMEVSQRQKGFNFNNKSYITIDGLEFKYYAFQGIGLTTGTLAGYNQEVLIQNCKIGYIGLKNGASMGIQIYHSNSIIRNNIVHDCGRRGIVLNNGLGLLQNITIDGNTMYSGFHTTGIDIQVVPGVTSITRNITISNNITYDDKSHPVGPPENSYPDLMFISEQSHSDGIISNIKIFNNVFKYPVQAAMALENVDSAYIYNNTIYGSNDTISQFGFGIGISGIKANHTYIKNNLFYGTSVNTRNRQPSAVIKGIEVPNSAITSDYNLFYEDDPLVILISWGDGSMWYDRTQWNTYKSTWGQDSHSVNPTNPMFVNPPTDLRLQSSSPAIAAGIDVGLPFYGSEPDIGAFEYGCNTAAPSTYILAPTSPNEIYITDASGRGWKGGDTLKISSQYHYTTIEIDNFKGDSCRPIIIIDSGAGFVHTDKMVFGGGAEYYKVLGTGNPLVTYGFKVTGAGTAIRINKSRHYTFSNIEVTNSLGAGVLVRYDPNLSDTASLYPNYRMPKCIFTKIYVHSTEGEGFYVGSSDPSGTDPSYTPPGYYPNRLDSVEISNCIVDSTGWDGIQLSCGGNGDVIKNNIITNFGYLDLDAQRAGIILGSACQGDVDSNRISKGTGNAIELYGYGAVRCRWNTIDSTGLTIHHVGGEENIYTADYSVSPETVPRQTILIDHNAINHPPIIGAVKVNNAFGNIDYTTITNNTFCIPSAGGSWQTDYIHYPSPNTISNNTLFCGAPTGSCSNCIIGLFKFK